MTPNNYDYLILGAGVVGISIGLELRKRFPKAKICLLDKEAKVAYHSSGRNSGVLHAGFYYTADSLKAKFTRVGNEYLRDYCKVKGLKLNTCGKLVVTKNESELPALDELFKRAHVNSVELHECSEAEAKKIEPRVKTYQRAAWSPLTATIDPLEVMNSLLQDCLKSGIEVLFETRYLSHQDNTVLTNKGSLSTGFVINAAGLYADRIAQDYGFSLDYRILPFKGLYIYCSEPKDSFKTHIYPVPNLKNPFLGVHHTMTVDGRSKIGPTAVPALWREQYDGLSRFKIDEALRIIADEIQLFFTSGFDFRSLALEEIKKYNRDYLVKESATMATGVNPQNYTVWGKPGIRAQLLNIRTKKLEMDFKIEGDQNSLHVLNAVSPAFTCSQPFAEYICNHIGQKRNSNAT